MISPRATLLPLFLLAVSPTVGMSQIDSSAWRIVNMSSQNVLTGELAQFAFDAQPETQWHTRWHDYRSTPPAEPPHFITIDFRTSQRVCEIRYRARAHGEGGLPKDYRLELASELFNWQQVAAGRFSFRSTMSPHATITLEQPVSARYLRLTVDSVYESPKAVDDGLVVGELEVATPTTPLVPTTAIPVPQSREWNAGGYNWRDRHRDLLALAASQPARLVFIGDSITHRWGALPHDPTPRTGATIWQKYYGHRQALNLGYGWDRIENMLWRLQHGELENAQPQLVIVMAGTNNFEVDSPADIAAGVSRLCDEIHRQKPSAHILLLAIFPRGVSITTPQLDATNRYLAELDARTYITFKDIGKTFLNQHGQLTEQVMPDLLHPNAEGYRRWATAIEPIVAAFLQDTPIVE